MPTSKRDSIKRKHTAISNALTRSMEWTIELLEMFKPHHPKYAEGYANIFVMIEQARTFIDKMSEFI